MDTRAEEFRKFIEQEVIKILNSLAEQGKISDDEISEIATLCLDLIRPGMTLDQLYQGAVKLDDKHAHLAPLVFRIMKHYEEVFEKRAIDQVSSFIKSGKYDEAQEMVKKVLEYKATQ